MKLWMYQGVPSVEKATTIAAARKWPAYIKVRITPATIGRNNAFVHRPAIRNACKAKRRNGVDLSRKRTRQNKVQPANGNTSASFETCVTLGYKPGNNTSTATALAAPLESLSTSLAMK